MATLFKDYEQLVLQDYEQKKVNNALSHGLKHLTPARLKEECKMRCGEHLSKRDEKVIRDFCGDLNESRTCLAMVQHCDPDKFRPLVNLLKGKSESTYPKNIELLAWLIDFPGRPWELGKTYPVDTHKNPGLHEAGPVEDDLATDTNPPTDKSAPGSNKPTGNPITPEGHDEESGSARAAEPGKKEILKGKTTKRLAAAIVLSLALGTGGAWWWKDNDQLPDLSGGCMYWYEDHYEPIACNGKIPNARIIALDTIKLNNFRKVTRPDTITYQAIGRVWYSKIDGKIEFYTSGGEHPVIFGRRLKPITMYMIDKYIRSGMITK